MTRRIVLIVIALGCVGFGAFGSAMQSGIASSLLALVAGIACCFGTRAIPTRERAPWTVISIGVLASAGGEALYTVLQARGIEPFPSVADAFYLVFYPATAASLAMMSRRRCSTGRGNAVLDTVMVIIAASAVVWALVIQPSAGDTTATSLARVLSVAYPVGDLLLLGAVTRLALGGGLGNASIRLIGLGTVAMLIGDLIFSILASGGVAVDDHVSTVVYLVAYTCLGFAALHPQAAGAAKVAGEVTKQQSVGRLAALVSCALSVPVTLWIHAVTNGSDDVTLAVLTVATIATFTLVAIGAWSLGRVVTMEAERRADARFAALVRNAGDIILIVDDDRRVTYLSPAGERVWERRIDDEADLWFAELLDDDSLERAGAAIDTCVQTGSTSSFEVRTGHQMTLDCTVVDQRADADVGGMVITMRDVTERRRLDAQLAHQAFHDALTGLSNRALFRDRLTNALARTARLPKHDVTVMFLDLDGFKTVNDTHGHRTGDALLVCVAQRLEENLRVGDTAARFGGDEFAVLLEATRPEVVDGIADRLLRALHQPLMIDGRPVQVSASIGIANAGRNEDPETVLHHADLAMFDAKAAGKHCVRRFDAVVNELREARAHLRDDLAEAWTTGQMELRYQPIVSLADGRIIGAEALLRWQHPQFGEVSPSDFIPIAEESGAIVPLGRWVLDEATHAAASWPSDEIYVSVNISGVQLDRDDLVAHIDRALSASRLAPARLMLELTESSIVRESGPALARLRQLDARGVKLAIDDFGTGYSSLAYLHQLPMDHLKIDRRFVEQIGTAAGSTLARSIVLISSSMSITAIAEGIETEEQRDQLASMGCQLGQGYWFSPPVTARELQAMIAVGSLHGHLAVEAA